MTKDEIQELIDKMSKSNEKSAIASTTIWAQAAAIFCGAVVALPELAAEVAPILSVPGAGYVIAGAGVLTVIRRIFCEQKPITSVLPK